jgi:hypothetical protein
MRSAGAHSRCSLQSDCCLTLPLVSFLIRSRGWYTSLQYRCCTAEAQYRCCTAQAQYRCCTAQAYIQQYAVVQREESERRESKRECGVVGVHIHCIRISYTVYASLYCIRISILYTHLLVAFTVYASPSSVFV